MKAARTCPAKPRLTSVGAKPAGAPSGAKAQVLCDFGGTAKSRALPKTIQAPPSSLIAPCGMDCSTCSFYLAFIHDIPKKRGHISHCAGCRPRNKQCAYLKGQCELLADNKIEFCFECDRYPCERLRKFDRRYRHTYGVSPIENLELIRMKGVAFFLRQQGKHHGCPNCGGMISIHNQKCFVCDKVERWKA